MLDKDSWIASRVLEAKNLIYNCKGSWCTFITRCVTIKNTLGHYARVLVDIDLVKPIQDQILVEREGFAFLVGIEYEFLPSFCMACSMIGHSIVECRRILDLNKEVLKNDKGVLTSKEMNQKYVPKTGNAEVLKVGNKVDVDKGKGVVIDDSPRVMICGETSNQINKVVGSDLHSSDLPLNDL